MSSTTWVLLIEHDKNAREAARLELELGADCKVAAAASSAEARGLAALLRPDLILLGDLSPDEDVLALWQGLQMRPSARPPLLMVLVGGMDPQAVERLKNAGARTCPVCSLDTGLLVEAVSSLIQAEAKAKK